MPVHPDAGDPPAIRQFDTGATRDTDEGKYDYEGFLSPRVIERYGEYMHKNRTMRDGSIRDSDNWQKGMGLTTFMKSGWRHFFDQWRIHRVMVWLAESVDDAPPTNAELVRELPRYELDALEEDLCGVLFNTFGYLHELIIAREEEGV